MIKHQHHIDDQIDGAMQKEKDGDLSGAEKAYLKILGTSPTAYKVYDRLMVIYRKQKEYRKELAIIGKAIKVFETNLLANQKEWITRHKAAARLSKSLAISLGVMDKKGLPVTADPMLEKWQKRKELVHKRIEKAKKQ
jgi:tetratricopeptide (TPR) repeat protein